MSSSPPGPNAEEEPMSEKQITSITNAVFMVLLLLAVISAWYCRTRRSRFMHETGINLIYGAICGLLIQAAHLLASLQTDETSWLHFAKNASSSISRLEDTAYFDPELFYNVLLPPIIFNAGYGMKKRSFFRNIGSIASFAFIGTILTWLIVGLGMYYLCQFMYPGFFAERELLYFGALISATDPVTVLAIFNDLGVEKDLNAIVSGESVLNDAVAIVLTTSVAFTTVIPNTSHIIIGSNFGTATPSFTGDRQTVQSAIWIVASRFFVVFLGSFLIGAVIAVISALITKFSEISRHPLIETSVFALTSYLSYLLAESCELSGSSRAFYGIVSLLFCGMCQAHYTYNNLSIESQLRTKQLLELVNFLSEAFIFTYIGVSLFLPRAGDQADIGFQVVFILISLVLIFVARMIHVYGLSFLINLKRKPKIPFSHQHMIVFAGLRGAIAYALVAKTGDTAQFDLIYRATSTIIVFTVLVNGSLSEWVIGKLKIPFGEDQLRHSNNKDDYHQLKSLAEDGVAEDTGMFEWPPGTKPSKYNPYDKSKIPRIWYNFDADFVKPLLTHSYPTLMETTSTRLHWFARRCTSRQQMIMRLHSIDSLGRPGQSAAEATGSDLLYGTFAPMEDRPLLS